MEPMMSVREADRLLVIRQVIEGKLTWEAAGKRLKVCRRQVGRMVKRVREYAAKGLIHRLRGRQSNHRLKPEVIEKAIILVEKRYPDFGPSFANEKLSEVHGLTLSTSTLRKQMIAKGLWKPKRPPRKHRAWRERRASFGELVQVDGSIHPWFENRGGTCWLIAFIDDATSRVEAEFTDAEDTVTLMRLAKGYIKKYGRPLAWYVDKDSIYRVTRQASIDEELIGIAPETQFKRAMRELDVEVICANSPQAKGRVERGFGTHQDRLVKELRLAGINTKEEANRFLREVYLPKHNQRFSVQAANSADAHRPLRKKHNLDLILSLQYDRRLANDFTFNFQGQVYQVLADQPVRLRPRDTVQVQQWLDGSLHLRAKASSIGFKALSTRPIKQEQLAAPPNNFERPPRPRTGHPWKQYKGNKTKQLVFA